MNEIFKNYNQSTFKLKRKLLDLRAKDVAEVCHMSRQAIGYIENGNHCKESSVILIGVALDRILEQRIEELDDEKAEKLADIFDAIDSMTK